MIEMLHWASIVLEAVIALLGIKLVSQQKSYGWGIFITFTIYVFYDISKYLSLDISPNLLYIFFFVASISAFLAVWNLVKK